MYKELFQLEIAHAYYSEGGDAGLTIVADEATQQFMQGRSFLIKPTRAGLRVLMPVDENLVARTTFLPDDVLRFEVYPSSSHFGIVTDTSSLAPGEVLHFSNVGFTESETELAITSVVGRGTHNGFQLCATVAIHIASVLLAQPQPPRYRATFNTKSEVWKYYFVSEQESTDFKVEDREEKLLFNQVQLGENSSDIVGGALQRNFPQAKVFLFESAASITQSEQAIKNLQLLRDGEVIIQHLPNPDVADAAIKIIKI